MKTTITQNRLNSMRFLFLLLAMTFTGTAVGQTAAEVLEKGKKMEKNEKLFIRYQNGKFNMQAAETPSNPLPPEGDSAIFLPVDHAVNVYIKPLNPLNNSVAASYELAIDPINKAAEEAYKSLTDQLDGALEYIRNNKETATNSLTATGRSQLTTDQKDKVNDKITTFEDIIVELKKLKELLNKPYKEQVKEAFETMKKLDFVNKTLTENSLKTIQVKIDTIKKRFDDLDKSIKDIRTLTTALSDSQEDFNTKNIVALLLERLEASKNEQYKRYSSLKNVKKLLDDYVVDCLAKNYASTDDWYVLVETVMVPKNQIATLTVKITQGGYEIVEEEIVPSTKKEQASQTIRFRRFDKWVPEISGGFAWTFINYSTYSLTEDDLGQQVVTSVPEKLLSNAHATTMVNFVRYNANSSLNYFIQVGVGANADIPSLFLGNGFRTQWGINRKFAFAGGVALTFRKQLDELKVGDIIDGDAVLQEDLKYMPCPKLYFGIQMNF